MAITRRGLLGGILSLLALPLTLAAKNEGPIRLPASVLPPLPDLERQLRRMALEGVDPLVHARLAAVFDSPVPRQRLASLIREDFRLGRTRRVDGWLLSEAEVCLCALCGLGKVELLPA